MANLSLKQQKIIKEAKIEELEIWMQELSTGLTWTNIRGLYEELNKERLRRDGLKL